MASASVCNLSARVAGAHSASAPSGGVACPRVMLGMGGAAALGATTVSVIADDPMVAASWLQAAGGGQPDGAASPDASVSARSSNILVKLAVGCGAASDRGSFRCGSRAARKEAGSARAFTLPAIAGGRPKRASTFSRLYSACRGRKLSRRSAVPKNWRGLAPLLRFSSAGLIVI